MKLQKVLWDRAKRLSFNKVSFQDKDIEIVPLHIENDIPKQQHRSSNNKVQQKQSGNQSKAEVQPQDLFEKAAEKKALNPNKEKSITKNSIVGILGEAGSGKTTLTRTLLRYIVEEKWFSDLEYVFYLPFRKISEKDSQGINATHFDLLSLLLFDEISQEELDWLMNENQRKAVLKRLHESKKVCVIFDGLDEANFILPMAEDSKESKSVLSQANLYSSDATAEEFVINILGNEILPHAKKLITSRPRHLVELHQQIRPPFLTYIRGIDLEAQKQICDDICDKKELAQLVFAHIQDDPSLAAYCFVPIHCILVVSAVLLLLQQPTSSPNCITEVIAINLGVFKKDHNRGKLKEGYWKKIASLAWRGFRNDQYEFSSGELEQADLEMSDSTNFLITTGKLSLFSGTIFNKVTYFSHLILQEFFVASYLIFFMDVKEFRQSFFRNYLIFPAKFNLMEAKFEMVMKFLFGLCNNTLANKIREVVSEQSLNDIALVAEKEKILQELVWKKLRNSSGSPAYLEVVVRVCTWIYEMHNDEFTEQIANSHFRKTLMLYNTSGRLIKSTDIKPLHYVLQASKEPIYLYIKDNNSLFQGDGLLQFLKEMVITAALSPTSVIAYHITLFVKNQMKTFFWAHTTEISSFAFITRIF